MMPAQRADAMPPWRANLLAIPTDRRSASQRDLVRGLELADFIKEEFKRPGNPLGNHRRTLKIMLAGVEALVLGPIIFSAIRLQDIDSMSQCLNFVGEVNTQALMWVTSPMQPPLTPPQALVAVLAFIQFVMLHPGYQLMPKDPETLYVFDAELEALDWTFVLETLTTAGSGLTVAALKLAIKHVRAELRLSGDADYSSVEFAVNEVIIPAMGEAVPSPYAFSAAHHLYRTIFEVFEGPTPPEMVWGVRLDSEEGQNLVDLTLSAYDALVSGLERAVAAAEAEGDDGRVAFLASKMTCVVGLENMRLIFAGDIKAWAAKTTAAMQAARPYLPRLYRTYLSPDHVTEALANSPDGEPVAGTAFYNVTGMLQPEPNSITGPAGRLTHRTCAKCGSESTELMRCSGCGSKWYCGAKCQVSASVRVEIFTKGTGRGR